MSRNQDREFTKLAIIFILRIVVGFALVLLGIVFLMIGILSIGVENYNTPPSSWFMAAIVAESIGILLMYFGLRGTPEPGTISNSGKYQGKNKFF